MFLRLLLQLPGMMMMMMMFALFSACAYNPIRYDGKQVL